MGAIAVAHLHLALREVFLPTVFHRAGRGRVAEELVGKTGLESRIDQDRTVVARMRSVQTDVGGVEIDTGDFVRGSGELNLKGNDGETTLANGRIKNFRRTVTPAAAFDAQGDKSTLNSDDGLGVAVTLKRGSTTVRSLTGIVSARYNENAKTTRVTITCDPEE